MSRLQPRRFAQSCMNAKSMRVLLQTKGKPPQHTLAEVLQPRLHIGAELSSGPVQPAPLGVLRNEEWSPLDVLGSPRTRGAAPTPGTSCSCPRSSLSAAPPASAGIARTPPGSSPSNTLWPPRCRGIHGCCCPLTGRCGWCPGKHAALACDTALQGTAAKECCCYCGPQRPCLPS